MNTRQTFMLTFTFFISLCHGQVRERFYMNDLKRQKLNGKVKEVKFVEYEAIYNTKDSTYTLEIYDILTMKNNISSFNKFGYLEKKTELSFDNKDSMSISAIWTYKYDNQNRIVKEFRDSKKYGDTSSWNYKYDKNKTFVKYYAKNFNVLYYEYTQINDLEILTTANSDSSYQRKVKFIYDNQNRLIRYENYENTDSIVNLRILSYNNKSRNVKIEINDDKRYKNKINKSFEYDKNGNVEKIFNEKQKLIGWFEYVYDRNKNWIEQKCYNSRGKIYNVNKREISYY